MRTVIIIMGIMLALLLGVLVGQAVHLRSIEHRLAILTEQALLSHKMSVKVDEYNARVKEHNAKMIKD